jgi:hypothetical protein
MNLLVVRKTWLGWWKVGYYTHLRDHGYWTTWAKFKYKEDAEVYVKQNLNVRMHP